MKYETHAYGIELKSKMFLKSEMKEIEIHFVNWF